MWDPISYTLGVVDAGYGGHWEWWTHNDACVLIILIIYNHWFLRALLVPSDVCDAILILPDI